MRITKSFLWPVLALVLCSAAPHAFARCYKVIGTQDNPGVTSGYIKPSEGVAASWAGACDTCNGNLGIPSVINLSSGDFIPPGTMLASSVAPFVQYGTTGGYDPERVFFRCAPEDPVYEMYSTNGDNYYSGHPTRDKTGLALGLEAAYETAWDNILLRLTNVTTGEYFTDIWKERLLTDLDTDSHGYRLVKAKNLSTVRAEVYSSGGNQSHLYANTRLSQIYAYTQPSAYIAIKGPGLAAPTTGNSHVNDFNGWASNWPGAIGMYRNVTLKRYPTCVVLNATPYVFLPSVSRNDIENGTATSEVPFQISFKCQNAMVSGTGNNQTALGILASPGAYAAAPKLGLVNAQSGISHLVSDNYGSSGYAEGVGIRILRDNNPINLLSSENSALGGANANQMGWYPIIGNNTVLTGNRNGVDFYTENFRARLEKLPQAAAVTPGRVRATATVVIRVQ